MGVTDDERDVAHQHGTVADQELDELILAESHSFLGGGFHPEGYLAVARELYIESEKNIFHRSAGARRQYECVGRLQMKTTLLWLALGAMSAWGQESSRAKQDWASPLDKLKPGEWFEVPNSSLAASGVWPPQPCPPGNGPGAVMGAWSGAAYDTRRERLIIHGGGHGDYAGNEIYVFDVKTFKWSRPWGPSKDIPPAREPIAAYPDGNPAAVHSYDGLIYLPKQDRLWRGGGSTWSGSGGGTRSCWSFDFEALKWERKADAPGGVLGVSVFADYDPVTGHIFASSDHYGFAEYDPATDTWTKLGTIGSGEEPIGVVDPVNRLFVVVGNKQLNVFNLTTRKTTNSVPSTGGDEVVSRRGPGLVYDPTLKKIVGWGGGTSLYTLDVSNWTWTEHPASKTNTVVPAVADKRLICFSKFQYIPSKKVYIVVTGVKQSVYFFKMPDSGK